MCRIKGVPLQSEIGSVLEYLLSLGVREGRGLLVEGVQESLFLPRLQDHFNFIYIFSIIFHFIASSP
jgi:hypothetical protein